MDKQLNVGVIGTGAIGLHHLAGFRKSKRAHIIAVAETSPERLEEAASKFQVPFKYTDYRDLLKNPDVRAVSIALPNNLHAPVALEALKAGKHVMLEKPFAFSTREATQIIALAKKKKLTFMVGQNQRFSASGQKMKNIINQGMLGEVYHARAFWLRRSGIPRIGSWFTQKKFSGGGALLDIGVHLLDLAMYLMGNFQPESVTGITHAKFGPRGLGEGGWGKSEVDPKKPFDVDDYAAAFIKLKGGKSVVLEVAWACHRDPHGSDNSVQLFGTEGGAETNPFRIFRSTPQGTEISLGERIPLLHTEDREVHFVDCVLDRKTPLVRPEESLAIQKILDGIYESSRTGREVRIR